MFNRLFILLELIIYLFIYFRKLFSCLRRYFLTRNTVPYSWTVILFTFFQLPAELVLNQVVIRKSESHFVFCVFSMVLLRWIFKEEVDAQCKDDLHSIK